MPHYFSGNVTFHPPFSFALFFPATHSAAPGPPDKKSGGLFSFKAKASAGTSSPESSGHIASGSAAFLNTTQTYVTNALEKAKTLGAKQLQFKALFADKVAECQASKMKILQLTNENSAFRLTQMMSSLAPSLQQSQVSAVSQPSAQTNSPDVQQKPLDNGNALQPTLASETAMSAKLKDLHDARERAEEMLRACQSQVSVLERRLN